MTMNARPSPGRSGRRRSVSQSFLIDLLLTQLERWQELTGRGSVSIVDIGGGTGGLAVALAGAGHEVTVIDPSPDALAALQRRAAEADLSDYIHARQGDTSDLTELVGPGGTDVVLCHRVLEIVDAPERALTDIAEVLDAGGLLSLLVSQRFAVLSAQAGAGDFDLALRTWRDEHLLDRRRVLDLLAGAGFEPMAVHGIGAVSDHVSEQHVERPERFEALYRLEAEISENPDLAPAAPLLHVLATRSRPTT